MASIYNIVTTTPYLTTRFQTILKPASICGITSSVSRYTTPYLTIRFPTAIWAS